MNFKFTDGVEIDTSGPFRMIEGCDGLYIVGHDNLCAVDSRAEGDDLLRKLADPAASRWDTTITTSVLSHDPFRPA